MNKTAIKNFAIWARNKLIADIKYKAGLLGITEKVIKSPLPQSTNDVQFFDIGTKEPYSIDRIEMDQRDKLAAAIHNKAQQSDYPTAYQAVIEEVAYTWFNRLIAVRFMEVNNYLPSRIRVLSSESAGKNEPDLVTNPFDTDLDFTPDEKDRIAQLKNDNQLDGLFRRLFIKQCNALNAILPNLFEKTCDYTELLLNVAFTDKDGVVYHLTHDILEDDFNVSKEGQVEIIGWLYQYYNTELNELVYDGTMSKSRIPKELLPAATTIYTPDWAIRYMVENSLGRLWLEGHSNDTLQSEWKYYLDEVEQEADVQKQLDVIREEYKAIKPEDIKVIDPCMGSGHILVYAFDVLMQIYESYGYSQRDAAKSIIENNIYGLDIDDRAYQLAYFAVMMKARQYNRRITSGETDCHVYSIQESNGINREQLKYFGAGMDEIESNIAMLQIQGLLDIFIDAKEYGSILNVENYNWRLLYQFVDNIKMSGQMSFDTIGIEDTQNQLRLLVEIGAVVAKKYDVVVTNPPYLGSSRFSPKLLEYVNKKYADAKSDLSMVMYKKAIIDFSIHNGMIAFITTSSWMFLKSFENMRLYVLKNIDLDSLVDFGTELFEGKVGHNPIVAWVTRTSLTKKKMTAVRLVDFCYSRRTEKKPEYFNPANRHFPIQENFFKIPGMPIAYWVSNRFIKLFETAQTLKSISRARSGAKTGKNELFLRLWWEVVDSKLSINTSSYEQCMQNGYKWYPHNKGGDYRNWYGNNELVINFFKGGYEIKKYGDENNCAYDLGAKDVFFHEGITWTALTGSKNSFRYSSMGHIFDTNKGPMIFDNGQHIIYYLLGFFISPIAQFIMKVVNPSLSLQNGDMDKLPIIIEKEQRPIIENLVQKNMLISKNDWDNYETSWDFRQHPFLIFATENDNLQIKNCELKNIYQKWNNFANSQFVQLKDNEEEINRIFIKIYDLQDELTPQIEDKSVTIRKADLGRDIRSFVSYAVGCMFGRYSLDVDGLLFAGGEYSVESGVMRVKCSDGITKLSTLNTENYFPVIQDNILPIIDEEYLEADIVGLFVAFVKKVYSEETLEQNLDFIAKALGNKGNTSREIIRNYFVKDFFKDHCKIYHKRPIYWLFDSGKADGFKALIYMHRYDENTIGNLRIDYLHQMQRIYDREIVRMQETINNSTNAREVVVAEKRKEKLTKQLKETKDYDEKIAHLALARIAIDLDDGVKVNYEKVQTGTDGKKLEVLAKI